MIYVNRFIGLYRYNYDDESHSATKAQLSAKLYITFGDIERRDHQSALTSP